MSTQTTAGLSFLSIANEALAWLKSILSISAVSGYIDAAKHNVKIKTNYRDLNIDIPPYNICHSDYNPHFLAKPAPKPHEDYRKNL